MIAVTSFILKSAISNIIINQVKFDNSFKRTFRLKKFAQQKYRLLMKRRFSIAFLQNSEFKE